MTMVLVPMKGPNSQTVPFKSLGIKEFFAAGNGTSSNIFTVPNGCKYIHLQWLVGAGGGGGGANGDNGFAAVIGGGGGAWVQDVWFYVQPNCQVVFNIGSGGRGNVNTWGSSGGASSISIINLKTGTQAESFYLVGGGLGGSDSTTGNKNYLTDGAGGTVINTIGGTTYNGNHAEWNLTVNHPYHDDDNQSGGTAGGVSPIPGTTWGQGGSSASYMDARHASHSSGYDAGHPGGDGYARIEYFSGDAPLGTSVIQIPGINFLTATIPNVAPLLTGTILADDLNSVRDFYNNNYPEFAFSYDPGIKVGDTVTPDKINGFFTALGSCNSGWKGWTALPEKTVYQPGETIVEVQFGIPTPNFSSIADREFFTQNNGTSANTYTVPPGCQYVQVQWLMAGGGGGGDGDGNFYNAADWPARGGGAGAFIRNAFFAVQYGDVITVTVGSPGWSPRGSSGQSGGDSIITVFRPSANTTYEVMHVTGGQGGLWNKARYGTTWTYGGTVLRTLGWTGYAGANSPGGPMFTDPQPGCWGAGSPLGSPGFGSYGSAGGYGAGGGGASFVD